MNKEKIAIAGSHGFIGSRLVDRLKGRGEIIRIPTKLLYNTNELYEVIKDADVIINVAGVPIYKIWTKRNKKKIHDSRVLPTRNLVKAINKVHNKSVYFINSSAVGIYGSEKCYDEENAVYADNFLAKVLMHWEKEVFNVDKNHKFAIMRFGVVMGAGGYLGKVLPSYKMGLKVTLGSGDEFFSYVHIDDLERAVEFLIEKMETGVYNITSGEEIRIKKVNSTIGKYYHTFVSLKIPKRLLKWVIGEQSIIFTEGQCIKPKAIIDKGFEFKYTSFEEVIKSIKRKIN